MSRMVSEKAKNRENKAEGMPEGTIGKPSDLRVELKRCIRNRLTGESCGWKLPPGNKKVTEGECRQGY